MKRVLHNQFKGTSKDALERAEADKAFLDTLGIGGVLVQHFDLGEHPPGIWTSQFVMDLPTGLQVSDGRKDDAEKPRWDLVPWGAMSEVVKVLTCGAKKYAPEGWKTVPDWRRRYFAATCRHLISWTLGEKTDPETGLHHLAHAACCVLFCIELDK